jgi:hypothetical protein
MVGSSRETCRLYIGHFLRHWPADLGHRSPDIMRDEPDRITNPKRVEKGVEVAREHVRGHLLGRTGVGLVGIAEAPQVRGEQFEAVGEFGHAPLPDPGELWPAVEQDQRRTAALVEIVDLDAIRVSAPRLGHDDLHDLPGEDTGENHVMMGLNTPPEQVRDWQKPSPGLPEVSAARARLNHATQSVA